MTMLHVLSHAANVAIYSFTIYYAMVELKLPRLFPKNLEFDPGQLKYLTIWNLIIQAVFFFICLLNDFYGTNAVNPKKRPFIRKVKDYTHAVFSFPVGMFVGVTFWALMFVDRELVLPRALDPYFPTWLNHLMHTLIMVSTIFETILAPRQYPKRSHGLGGLLVFKLIYLIWVHVIYVKSGIWVYPVMEVLSLPLRILFFLVLFAFSTILYFAGEALDHLIWGNGRKFSGKSSKKKKSK